MRRRLRCGIAIEIGRAVASIVALAVFWLLALEAWDPLKTKADDLVVNSSAQQATDWLGIGMDNFLVITLGIAVMGVIAAAVYQRQGGF